MRLISFGIVLAFVGCGKGLQTRSVELSYAGAKSGRLIIALIDADEAFTQSNTRIVASYPHTERLTLNAGTYSLRAWIDVDGDFNGCDLASNCKAEAGEPSVTQDILVNGNTDPIKLTLVE